MELPTKNAALPVPPLACDCHMHVFGPPEQYPPAAARGYTPTERLLGEYLTMAGGLGLQRVVLVQPSAYGADNRCMLDALRQHPGTSRGVAVIDGATTEHDLHRMDALGVRGTRLNLVSHGAPEPAAAAAMVAAAARRVEPLGWHVQVFADIALIAALAPALRDLGTRPVIDHMGHPRAALGLQQPGFEALLQLLGDDRCWVKLSGANRVSAHATDYADAAPFARALIAANPDRVVWGSDWPHIDGHPPAAHEAAPPVRYRDLDNRALLQQVGRWSDDPAAAARILTDNPAALYGF